jgi:S-(hydroxymethyl)glutathione dehydrogenase/alcohol dehydrogenase
VNPNDGEATKRVQEITEGGADFAFEAYGSGATTKMAVDMVRKGGTAVIVGIAPLGDTAEIEPVYVTRMEKTIRGCYYGSSRPRQDMPRIADWYLQGRVDIDGLITRRYTLDDINRAYQDLESDAVGRGVLVF